MLKVIFMGTSAFVIPVLYELVKTVAEVMVYTKPDKPSGRGRNLREAPVKKTAMEMNIPIRQPKSLLTKTAETAHVVDELCELNPDVIVVASYGLLLPKAVIDCPRYGCLNVHPSLLPRYRGPSPIIAAILDGQATTGVSVMKMDEGLDTGPILAQKEIAIRSEDTTKALTEALFIEGATLLVQVLADLANGRIDPLPQDESMASHTRKIVKSDGKADWSLTATQIERQIRAFNPWPILHSSWKGKDIRIIEAVAVQTSRKGTPGTVMKLDEESPVGIITGDGIIGVKKLQIAGGKPITSKQFITGHPGLIGSILPN